MVTVTDMLAAVEAAIERAGATRTRRRDVVLWLTGADQLPSLGVTARKERQDGEGVTEYGYTLAQARRIRKRLLAAFRDHHRSVSR